MRHTSVQAGQPGTPQRGTVLRSLALVALAVGLMGALPALGASSGASARPSPSPSPSATPTPAPTDDSYKVIDADRDAILGYNDGDTGVYAISAGVKDVRTDGVQLVGTCQYAQLNRPGSNDSVLTVHGEASAVSGAATQYGVPVSVGVICTATGTYDGIQKAKLAVSEPGTTAAGTTAVQGISTSYNICASMTATYSDTTVVRTRPKCTTLHI